MIREMMAAITFLTRVPVCAHSSFGAQEIGRAARWFPLVGMGVGAAYLGVIYLAAPFPPSIIGLLVVVVDVVVTGGLHLDGLADIADGFGGGRTREDVLRIMHDHAVGA